MDALIESIKESFVGETRISTVYEGNPRENLLTLLEEMGETDGEFAQNRKAMRPESRDFLEMLSPGGAFLYGPYYETTIVGGKLDGKSRRCNSVTAALATHEEMLETVKAYLRNSI